MDHRLNISPGSKRPLITGFKRCKPCIRGKRKRGERCTDLNANRLVRDVALRRTLGLFRLPHAINERGNVSVVYAGKHFKPCLGCNSGGVSLPHNASPLGIRVSAYIGLVRSDLGGRAKNVLTRCGRTSVRIVGKTCNPCVGRSKGGCGVPGKASTTTLARRGYGRVVTSSRPADHGGEQEWGWGVWVFSH